MHTWPIKNRFQKVGMVAVLSELNHQIKQLSFHATPENYCNENQTWMQSKQKNIEAATRPTNLNIGDKVWTAVVNSWIVEPTNLSPGQNPLPPRWIIHTFFSKILHLRSFYFFLMVKLPLNKWDTNKPSPNPEMGGEQEGIKHLNLQQATAAAITKKEKKKTTTKRTSKRYKKTFLLL